MLRDSRRACGRWAAVAGLSALLALPAVGQAQMLPPPENVVNLSASASTEVANDQLTVVFSVRREGPTPAPLQTQLKQALDAALAQARRVAKPGDVDVRTGNFSLNPHYTLKGAASGWVGQAELVVEGRDVQAIAKLTSAIDTMTIARVGWSLSRETREKVEAEMTAEAIGRFRAKADQTARLFGFTGWLLREVSVGAETPRGYAPPMALQARAKSAEMDMALPAEGGNSTVTANAGGSVQLTR